MPKVIYEFGDDISTDIIYPGRYMATVLPTETPQYAFEDITELNEKLVSNSVPKGSIIIAGKNFGCGSSREQAASALKGFDIVIIANNFARIFFQNSINLGLRTITCPGINANLGDEIEIGKDKVKNITKNLEFEIIQIPKARQSIVDAGGLIPYTRKKLIEQRTIKK